MAAGDLTTIDKVRAYLGIPSSSADDQLQTFVTAASQWVVTKTSRPILQTACTDTRDGDDGRKFLLSKFPATSDEPPLTVTSVTIDGETIPQRPDITAENPTPDGWYVNGRGVELSGYRFTRGKQNVTIVYSVGYVTVPADLEMAVIQIAALNYLRADRFGKSSNSIGGETVTYSPDAAVWASIMSTIDQYAALPIG